MSFETVRCSIVESCRKLADKGYLAGTGGNVAFRIDDAHFAITPSATDYYAMQPDDICVLRFETFECVVGERRPSVEFRLHANLFSVRRDCNASIHTHQPIASAYTVLGRPLAVTNAQHRAVLGPVAPLVEYAPSGTTWLAAKLEKTLLLDTNAYLLRNHGVVCCGPSLEETMARLTALEEACAAYFRDSIDTSVNPELLALLAPSAQMEPTA